MMPDVLNGTGGPQPAVTIHVVPQGQGSQIMVNHALAGGWAAVEQLLLTALHLAVQQTERERHGQEAPRITLASPHPRFRPEQG